MRNGKACGYGTVVYSSPKTDDDWKEHTGFFDNNVRSGEGVAISKKGDRYEGVWTNNDMNGPFKVKIAGTESALPHYYSSGKKKWP